MPRRRIHGLGVSDDAVDIGVYERSNETVHGSHFLNIRHALVSDKRLPAFRDSPPKFEFHRVDAASGIEIHDAGNHVAELLAG